MATILVCSSSVQLREQVRSVLGQEQHVLVPVSDYRAAFEYLPQYAFDLAIWDLDSQDYPVSEVCSVFHDQNPHSFMLFLQRALPRELIQQFVDTPKCDYLATPFNDTELMVRVREALEFKRLSQEAQSLRGESNIIYNTRGFVAESPAIHEVLSLAERVAAHDTTVLITGETGTGKELIAGAIHYNSARADNAFVKVNCAALPETLLESELFGHERGAFTGAEKQRIGRFEQAHEGTILLDETGEMSEATQVKLLRVLQDGRFERIGGTRTVEVDVRIIAATNADLEAAVEAGRFREDLFYRLNVVPLHVPPLRERTEDILPLAGFFLRKYARSVGRRDPELSGEVQQLLLDYHWPGNVRELQNMMERAVVMSEDAEVTVDDLDLSRLAGRRRRRPPRNATTASRDEEARGIVLPEDGVDLESVERSLIIQALERSNWVQKDAARLLGLTPRVMNYRVMKYGIAHQRWRRNRTRLPNGDSVR